MVAWRRTLALCGLLLVLAGLVGCKSTNIDERPDWAKAPRLQPENPFFPQYPPDRYLSVVEHAQAPTLAEAQEKARAEAHEHFLAQISSELRDPAAQGADAEATFRRNAAEVARKSLPDVAASIEGILGWDGYDRKDKVYFGCYVFDKQRAAELIGNRASNAFDRVETIGKRLAEPGVAPDEVERLSLETLDTLLDLSVQRAQLIFLGRDPAWIKDYGRVEMAAAERIYAAGKRREETGREEDLLEAKKFYDEAAKRRRDPLIDASIARVAARLPCPGCKPALEEVRARGTELGEAQRRLESGVDTLEGGRIAIEAIKGIARYRVAAAHGHAFFQERCGPLADFSPLEQECSKRVYAAGETLERSGAERDLEQALKLYEDAVAVRGDTVLSGRILEVKRRLPCLQCGRVGRCKTCDGQKGRNVTCRVCNGSQRVFEGCQVCGGDGQAQCGVCRGGGAVTMRCSACQGGAVRCGTCQGGGRVVQGCNWCGGSGRTWNGAACASCGASGRLQSPCSVCGGRGTTPCFTCMGRTTVNAACPQCGGRGRTGICQRCNGDRRVMVPCTRCRGGQVWEGCATCGESGLCTTCGGRAHRT